MIKIFRGGEGGGDQGQLRIIFLSKFLKFFEPLGDGTY